MNITEQSSFDQHMDQRLVSNKQTCLAKKKTKTVLYSTVLKIIH